MTDLHGNEPEYGSLTGTLLADRFKLLRLIGVGGVGEVYLAEHNVLGIPYAVKVLRETLADDPVIVGRFRREAYAASRLDHPNIVHTIDFGKTTDDELYLVMEFVDGPSVRQLLTDCAPFPLPLARGLRILTQVARALAKAHEANIIHRDLKPENILLARARDGSDLVKMLDFGLAKVLGHIDETPITQLGQIFGSPVYMSPEQASGQPMDQRSDIYSYGILAYEVVCGRPPFRYPSMPHLLLAHLEEQPPLPSTVLPLDAPPLPEALESLLLACLEKDPAARPASMQEVADALAALLAELPAAPRRAIPEDVERLLRESGVDAVPPITGSGSYPAVGPGGPAGPTLRATDLSVPHPGAPADPGYRAWYWGQAVKLALSLSERLLGDGLGTDELSALLTEAAAVEDASVSAEAEVALAESNLDDLDAGYAQVERDLRIAVLELSMTLGQHTDGLVPEESQEIIADLKGQIAVLEQNLATRREEKATRQKELEAEVATRLQALTAAHQAQTEAESRLFGALLRARPSPVPWGLRQDFANLAEMLRALRSM